jgi:uncharacterized alkaline shock family protein YloU
MSENLPTNVRLDANGKGTVTFATDVVATIAGLAATEVEGVANMGGTAAASFAELFKRGQNTRSLTRGVRVELSENSVAVHLTIVVDYGMPIPQVAKGIQENVKKAIENMSGLNVTDVNVYVQGVSFEKENRAAAEIEARQRLMLQQHQEDIAKLEAAAESKDVAVEAASDIKVEVSGADAEMTDDGEYYLDMDGESESADK